MAAPTPRLFYDQISSGVPSYQFVGKSGSAVNGQFEYGRSTWTEQWPCDPNNLQFFIDQVLGFAKKGGLSQDLMDQTRADKIINRQVPAQSYQFPQMYATAINGLEAMAPTGNAGGRAQFKLFKPTIQFETPPYDVFSNAQVNAKIATGTPAEVWRYCIWNRQPASEFARTPKDAFRYPSGQFPAGHSPITGSGGQLYLITKYRITCNWIQVPAAWITSNGLTFTNLDAAQGRVNDAEFLGYPKGTILFESYVPTPRTMPVDPGIIGIGDPGAIPRCYDVEMKFLLFDPKPIYVAPGQVEQDAPRGHNNVYEPRMGKWMRAIKIGATQQQETDDDFWLYFEHRLDNIFEAAGTGAQSSEDL